jgi:diacylglycerol kinase (ATP)
MATQHTQGVGLWLEGRRRSFGFAFRGMRRLCQETNTRIHAAATLSVVSAGAAARLSASEWALIVLCIGAVWTAEALNTALELLADAAVPEQHPLIGAAKDLGACGVLLSAVGSVIVGALVFAPYILRP